MCPDQAWSRSDIARDHPCECRQESAASAEQGSVLPVRGLNLHAGWTRLSLISDREIRQTPRLNWPAPCCPLSPDFLRMQRGVTWQRSCKKLGERAGVRGPFLLAVSQEIPPRGRRDFVHVANIDEKATSVKPTLQKWRCPVNQGRRKNN